VNGLRGAFDIKNDEEMEEKREGEGRGADASNPM
jgi:hypothetical protein